MFPKKRKCLVSRDSCDFNMYNTSKHCHRNSKIPSVIELCELHFRDTLFSNGINLSLDFFFFFHISRDISVQCHHRSREVGLFKIPLRLHSKQCNKHGAQTSIRCCYKVLKMAKDHDRASVEAVFKYFA